MQGLTFPSPEGGITEPRIVLSGSREMMIEKHQGLFSYETHSIRVRLAGGILTVKGKGLTIAYFGVQDMQIRGKIECIQMDGDER